MKGSLRSFFAAALMLGAAISSSQVRALDCPLPPYLRRGVTQDQLISIARSQVEKAPAIFIGHSVKGKYLGGARDNLPVFLTTYRVSEWKRGKGTRFASVLNAGWCDGNCDLQRMTANFFEISGEESFFISNPKGSYRPDNKYFKNLLRRVDGLDASCGPYPIIRLSYDKEPMLNDARRMFQAMVVEELEKLPSKRPSRKP